MQTIDTLEKKWGKKLAEEIWQLAAYLSYTQPGYYPFIPGNLTYIEKSFPSGVIEEYRKTPIISVAQKNDIRTRLTILKNKLFIGEQNLVCILALSDPRRITGKMPMPIGIF